MQTTSKVLKRPLLHWFSKTGTTRRCMAEVLGVSRQSPSDWTAKQPKPVTADNAARISEFANDTTLTMQIIYKFFGIFRPLDGDTYRKGLSAIDDLRELEEDERDQAQSLARRVLLKQQQKLTNSDYDLLLKFSKEQAEACFANIQYLNVLCEVQSISIMDLFAEFMPDWQKEGYFSKEV